jgi:hypothetical protein
MEFWTGPPARAGGSTSILSAHESMFDHDLHPFLGARTANSGRSSAGVKDTYCGIAAPLTHQPLLPRRQSLNGPTTQILNHLILHNAIKNFEAPSTEKLLEGEKKPIERAQVRTRSLPLGELGCAVLRESSLWPRILLRAIAYAASALSSRRLTLVRTFRRGIFTTAMAWLFKKGSKILN